MTKRRTALLISFLVLAFSLPAMAQGKPADKSTKKKSDDIEMPAEEEVDLPPADADPATPTDKDLETSDADVAPTSPVLTTGKRVESRRTWEDIVVIPRKPFIKKGRVDLTPTYGVTVNDNMNEHHTLGLEVDYHITDVLALGLIAQGYIQSDQDKEFWTRYHLNRVSSLNKYLYTFALSFSYVPIYGKMALLNMPILHYEVFISAGVGGSGTRTITKDRGTRPWTNWWSFTFPVGAGVRVFVTDFFAIQAGIRDYMMIDTFEGPRPNCPASGDPNDPCNKQSTDPDAWATREQEIAQENGKTRFINNLQFFLGLSFYLPPSFEYTTFR